MLPAAFISSMVLFEHTNILGALFFCLPSSATQRSLSLQGSKTQLLFCFPEGALVVKNQLANAGDIRDVGSSPGLGRSLGEGHGNPVQYSCLENPMDRRAWRATVHVVTELDMTEVT